MTRLPQTVIVLALLASTATAFAVTERLKLEKSPITGTRASPRFTWIVGGKAYQFCCPPCVEEFVRQAKGRPRTIHPPEYYVKH